MVWPFSKKRDVIDLTERRKISERGKLAEQKIRQEAGRYADLTDSGGGSDLFSAISNASSSSSVRSNEGLMSNKIDDIEFKLEQIRKKVDDLLNRMEVLERKSGLYGHT